VTFGFDAPLPPAESGVADYAGALLDALKRRADFVLPPAPADRWLYHVGNNREHHAGIYRRALQKPGVVVLHDAVLIHLMLSLSAGVDEFVSEFAYNYGGWHQNLGRRLWRDRARSAADAEFFRYPMLKRIATAAQAVIVHNPRAGALVLDHAPDARVVEIPHFAPDPAVDGALVEVWRERCAFPRSTYVFGVFGHLRESKRILAVLRALHRLRSEGVDAALLLAGRFQSESLRLAALPLMEGPPVRHFGYLAEPDLRALIALVDCGISLRWPAAGETSGIALRLMAAGKPVVLTRGGEVDSFPDGMCVKVDSGPMEEDLLAECLRWLAVHPAAGRRIGALAREHLARHHSLETIASRYLEVLQA
jgi:glycosyltransferase involved in cell wall biosynthesis